MRYYWVYWISLYERDVNGSQCFPFESELDLYYVHEWLRRNANDGIDVCVQSWQEISRVQYLQYGRYTEEVSRRQAFLRGSRKPPEKPKAEVIPMTRKDPDEPA